MVEKEDVIKALKGVEDPELKIDIYTLELVRDIQIEGDTVKLKITLTTPACPYGPALISEIETAVKDSGAKAVDIELVFSPPWEPPQHVKEMLGLT